MLDKEGDVYRLFEKFRDLFPPGTGFSGYFNGYNDLVGQVDCCISLGGDGTFLKAVSLLGDSRIPVVGINTGRLGFLSAIPIEEMAASVRAIKRGDFHLEERSLLQIANVGSAFSSSPYALNDITLQKNDSALLTVHVHVDGQFLSSYWADGIIFSTPTGSTAYSLSAGGPVVLPNAKDLLIISPIAPHNLNVRPLVITGFSEISLQVDARSAAFIATVDSLSEVMSDACRIKIHQAPFYVSVIRLKDKNFYTTLREKMMWGADIRN